ARWRVRGLHLFQFVWLRLFFDRRVTTPTDVLKNRLLTFTARATQLQGTFLSVTTYAVDSDSKTLFTFIRNINFKIHRTSSFGADSFDASHGICPVMFY